MAAYNAIVHSLQVASRDENIVHFRISEGELKPIVVGGVRGTARRPGRTYYSSESYCDHNYFKRQVEGLWSYIQKVDSQQRDTHMPRNYWAMDDGELEKVAIELKIPYVEIMPDSSWRINRTVIIDEALKPDKALRETNPPPSQVINVSGGMHGSSIQQGAHGLAVTINYKAMESEVGGLLANIRNAADQLALTPEAKKELLADMGTVESQLDSPSPKTSIITECLHSMRTILEHAAGAAIGHGAATGFAFELAKLLAHR